MLGTVHEIINVDETTRVVVYYDDDYQIDVDDSILDSVQALVDAGEVYGVSIQKVDRWALLAADGSLTGDYKDVWEDVESIWGCFLDDSYTALDVAHEYFPEHFTL